MPQRFDLQSHSRHSDGALSPADVVHAAAAAGVELLALSDHDTVAGVEEAIVAGRELGVRVVPVAALYGAWVAQAWAGLPRSASVSADAGERVTVPAGGGPGRPGRHCAFLRLHSVALDFNPRPRDDSVID